MATSIPDSINYARVPKISAKTKVRPEIIYPWQDSQTKISTNGVVRFSIPQKNAFWDPYSAFLKTTISLAKPLTTINYSTNAQTPLLIKSPNTTYDVQTSAKEYQKNFAASPGALPLTGFNGAVGNNTLAATSSAPNINIIGNQTKIADVCIQLDGGAKSLFQEVVLTSYNEDVERYQNIDVLLNMLDDVSFCDDDRFNRYHQGVSTSSTFQYDVWASNSISSTTGMSQVNTFGSYDKITMPTMLGTANSQTFSSDANISAASGLAQSLHNQFRSAYNSTSVTQERINLMNRMLNPYEYKAATKTFSDPLLANNNGNAYVLGVNNYQAWDSGPGFSKIFATSANEFFFTSSPVNYLKYGQPCTEQIISTDLLVPLPSAILGFLAPKDKMKLFPLHAIEQLILELRMNPNAFFTSYLGNNFDDIVWQIINIELHVNLVYFEEQFVNNTVIDTLMSTGISLDTCMWDNAVNKDILNQNQNQATALPNEILVNKGYSSMKLFMFCFLPLDYQTATCYRKNFRVSMCISNYQLRFNQDYWPSMPFQGNASTVANSPNNLEFYYALLKAFGKHHSPTCISINPSNFAICDRLLYMLPNQTVQGTDIQNLSLFNPISSTLDQEKWRARGNGQLIYQYENSVIGKSVFAVDFEESSYEYSQLSGIDTTIAKPWNILFQQTIASNTYQPDGQQIINNTTPFNRSCTLYGFAWCDVNILMKGSRLLRSGIY